MTASELAAIIISIAALAAVGVAVWVVIELRRSTEVLRATVTELRDDLAAMVSHVGAQAAAVDDELRRADGLLDTAERVSARADTLSKVTYGAVARPVIKTAAVVKGTSKAARRLRRGSDAGADTEAG